MKTIRLAGAGLTLAADVGGPDDAPPILFMHGGGQTRHSWGKAARFAVERGFRSISLDLRGHGDSDWASEGDYALNDFVADASEIIARLDSPVTIVGASLGGLTGLLLAGERVPDAVSALVLVDIAPRVETKGTDQIGAFMRSAPDGFASLEDAAAAVSAYLPHRPRPKSTRGLLKNLRLGSDGRYHWHWDPKMATSPRNPGAPGNRERLDEAARNLSIPTLLVRGGISQVVSQQSVDEFLAAAPHAEYANVSGADHMVAGDRNDAFNEAVFSFLDRNRVATVQP